MSNSSIIPNSFQCPNFYVDRLDYLLTPEESKVLVKAIREILGWEGKIVSRQANIALSVFVRGKTNASGEQLCYGCGIGLQTVREALAKLDEFNILMKVGQPASEGQLYQLQTDPIKIDWDGLQSRRLEWDSKNSERTAKATIASLEKRGVTSDVRGNVGCKGGVTSDVTQGVTSDVNKETHEKPNMKPNNGASAPPPSSPLTRHLTALWKVKRLNSSQAAIITELEAAYPYDKVIEAATWAHTKSMAFGAALLSIKKALPNWGINGNGGNSGKRANRNDNRRIPRTISEYKVADPAGFDIPFVSELEKHDG